MSEQIVAPTINGQNPLPPRHRHLVEERESQADECRLTAAALFESAMKLAERGIMTLESMKLAPGERAAADVAAGRLWTLAQNLRAATGMELRS